jgi:hypothetical protein
MARVAEQAPNTRRRIESRLLRLSRALAIVGGPLLIIGESVRRWHQFDEPSKWPSILDDYAIGAFLLLGAWRVTRDPVRGRAVLAGAWGLAVGIGAGSIHGHATSLDQADPSGLPHLWVFVFLLGLWVTAIAMLVLTLLARE